MTEANMKYTNTLFLTFLFFALSASAQLQIGLKIPAVKLIQYEPVPAELTIVNNSGTQLIFGSKKLSGHVEFLIIDRFDRVIKSFKETAQLRAKKVGKKTKKDVFNPAKGLILGAGETKTLKLTLNKHFPLSRAGEYKIIARIRHQKLGRYFFETKPQRLAVERGVQEAHKGFGVPDPTDTNKIIPRQYSIMSYQKETGDIFTIKIYDKNFIYAVHRLGPKVSGISITHNVDAFSNIHTLVQMKPKIFRHTIFTNKGKIKQEKYYKASFDFSPQLHRDTNLGKVSIIRGIPAVEGVDYNPSDFN